MAIYVIKRAYDPGVPRKAIAKEASLSDVPSGVPAVAVPGQVGMFTFTFDSNVSDTWYVFVSTPAPSSWHVYDEKIVLADEAEVVVPDPPPTSTTRLDLDSVFGHDNVTKWADLDNNGDLEVIGSRVAWSLDLATSNVRGTLESSTYKWSDIEQNPTIKHLIAIEAGILLYSPRAVSDEDAKENPMREHQRRYDKIIKAIHSGTHRLPNTSAQCATFPVVVE
jgi:hypothetical protein